MRQEWLACRDPVELLMFLNHRASDRQLRLFGCACLRRVQYRLTDGRLVETLQRAEEFADGFASVTDLRAPLADLVPESIDPHTSADAWAAASALTFVGSDEPPWYGGPDSWAVSHVHRTAAAARRLSGDYHREAIWQADLLHCLCPWLPGYLFNYAPGLADAVLAWNDGLVRSLAQGVYADRAFDRLPVLADALEDAGCSDAELLGHCRGSGPHARGCWVVDRILSKE